LSGIDFLAGDGQREPGGPIDFRDFDPAAGAAGELDAGGVADDFRFIGVGFAGPGVNQLAGFLLDGAERKKWSADGDTRFLRQLAAGGSERLFARATRPLGIDQAPASRFFQNGPPGWTRKTSSSPRVRRKSSSPAEIAEGRRIKKPPAEDGRRLSGYQAVCVRGYWRGRFGC